ncbi:unnamed protein product [Ceratitis capitata]|uniref:(Mediterranean fruit fly) hypothetical protein n=1 Tax=Ceratitis capitata TaxID=7213 RepID=A0A811VHY1_CERCA|nr:unnamed protein product [Ceratitis capitata]
MWRCSGGRAGVSRPESVRRLAAQVQHAPRREVRPVGPTCRAERKEAKPKALRRPGANRLRLRPYQPEGARSRLISEAKQGRACPSPPAGRGSGWPGPPDSRCRPGLPPRAPASPSAFAFGFQDTRRPAVPSPSGAPLACLRQSRGLHGLQPEPQPRPTPPASQAIAHAHVARTRDTADAQTGHLSCSLIPWVYLCLGVGLLNHTLLPLLVPSGTSIFFSIPLYPCPFLLTVEESSLCSTSSPALVIDRHRSEAQSDSCEVVPPWSLELSLSNH